MDVFGKLLPMGGLAVAAGFLFSTWSSLKNFFSQAMSRVVGRFTVEGPLVEAVGHYCWQNYQSSRFGVRKYMGWMAFVRKAQRVQLIALEHGTCNKLFWSGWKPIWVGLAPSGHNETDPASDNAAGIVTITFIRGTLDPDTFLSDVCKIYNEVRASYCAKEEQPHRHYIHIVTGSGDREIASSAPPPLGPNSSGNSEVVRTHDDVQWGATAHRLVGYDVGDIGRHYGVTQSSLDLLAMPEDVTAWIKDIRRWLKSENWYREHCIPWRKGIGLGGWPGTGKTSLIRAVSEDLDMPLFSYDLRTLRNSEMVAEWRYMLSQTPCVALIEDIDAVFHGRKNVTGHSSLSFDCLLNCIDGVRRSDGVLLAVTTNHVKTLDAALMRNGRLDKFITLGPLDKECCRKIAERILHSFPYLIDEVVRRCEGEVGALVQEICCTAALDEFWGESGDRLLSSSPQILETAPTDS